MIKWTRVSTEDHYPFLCYRTKKGYGDVILIAEPSEWNSKSLTNNIEKVLTHIIIGLEFGHEIIKNIKFYQWCDGEGLFEITPLWIKEFLNRGEKSVEWKFISKDLKAFEVLYCD